MMTRSSIGGPSFSLSVLSFNRGREDGNPICRLTGRSAQTTTRELATAVRGGWLVPSGDKRGRYYVLGPRLPATPAQGEVN
jgi:DNA-binding IclR family transcriptional regulator